MKFELYLKKINLRYSELYTISSLSFVVLLNMLFFWIVPHFALNIVIAISYAIFIIWIRSKSKDSKIYEFISNIQYLLGILIVYSLYQFLIKSLHPIDYDNLLISWDVTLLGCHPSDLLAPIVNPYLTEYLQVSYTLFYFLPIFTAVDLYYNNSKEFDTFLRNILFAYFFSYFLYFILPAIGPRFTIYTFQQINLELPGLFLTDILRWFINFGGGVTNTAVNPTNIVNRDCMPSGHTMITLVAIFYSFRFQSKMRWLVFIIGISIIFATIYLRYHYFVDIIAGIIFGITSYKIEPYINKIYTRKLIIDE